MKYNPAIVLAYFKSEKLPASAREFQFHPTRKWRFDFCWPNQKVALEIQGGIWMARGGHNTGVALRKEHEKRNEAARRGWRILYVEPKDLCTLDTVKLIRESLFWLEK